MTYRKFYAAYFGISIPREYDIHHIDFNRENNEISNLILLPRALHQRLHKSNRSHSEREDLFKYNLCANQLWCSILASEASEAAEIYSQMAYWAACKEMEMLRKSGSDCAIIMYSYNEFRKK